MKKQKTRIQGENPYTLALFVRMDEFRLQAIHCVFSVKGNTFFDAVHGKYLSVSFRIGHRSSAGYG